jgi:glucose-6-phosphate dehydrogenase assembly protein OpcA
MHAAAPAEDEDSPPLLKATTLTLVAASRGSIARETREAVDAVVDRHPARVMLLEFGGKEEPQRLTAGISAQCRITGPRSQVCSEEVHVNAGAATLQRLPALLRPLLLSDLPAVLWWDADLDEEGLLDDLRELFGLVVVDSARLEDGVTAFPRMAALRALDLAWLRLLPIRRSFADLVDRVVVEEGAGKNGFVLAEFDPGPSEAGARASAHLVAAWLASRLSIPRDHVEVRRRPRAEDREPLVRSATMRVEGADGEFTATVERLGSAPFLRSELSTGEVCTLPKTSHLRRASQAELLGMALDRCAVDPVLVTALEYLS